jgi:peptide/nickel transport system permease protein
MQRYIARRLLQTVLTLLAVSVSVIALARLSGDPRDVLLPIEATQEDRARISERWGLDKPLHIQYLTFAGNVLQGDFGESLKWPGQRSINLVLTRIGATLQLAAVAIVFSVLVAVPIGVLSAVYKNSRFDYIGKAIALLGQSVPHFWLGIVLMWIFAVHLGWLPSSGRGTIWHLILPAIVIGWFQVAALMRLVRSAMLEALDSEFVKLARIKGASERVVIWRHALRNAAIAPLTYFGVMIGYLMVGSITTEVVFSWPGAGLLLVDAVRARDFPVVQTVVLVFATVFILSNFVVDILYAYLDPRIRYE